MNERPAYITEYVIVEDNGTKHHGTFVGITKNGAIILQKDSVT
jgi:biotin-(acetyl-CoA carboxylase) ligase